MDFDCTAWVLVAINHSYTLLGFCIGCTSLGFGLAALWPQDCVGYALLVLILAAISWVLDGAAVALVASWL